MLKRLLGRSCGWGLPNLMAGGRGGSEVKAGETEGVGIEKCDGKEVREGNERAAA